MRRVFLHIVSVIFSLLFLVNANAQDTTVANEVPSVDMADTSVYETSTSHYHFKEVSSASSVAVRNIPEQKVQKIKSDEDYWYANLTPPRKKDEPPQKEDSVFDKAWFNT